MHEAILSLIADLYSQIGHLQTANQELQARLTDATNSRPPGTERPTT